MNATLLIYQRLCTQEIQHFFAALAMNAVTHKPNQKSQKLDTRAHPDTEAERQQIPLNIDQTLRWLTQALCSPLLNAICVHTKIL